MLALASSEDHRSPYFTVNRTPPPPKLAADDLSALLSHIFGEHPVQYRILFNLRTSIRLAVARSAGELPVTIAVTKAVVGSRREL